MSRCINFTNSRLFQLLSFLLMPLMTTCRVEHVQTSGQNTLHTLVLACIGCPANIISNSLRVNHIKTAFLDDHLLILRFFPLSREFEIASIIGASSCREFFIGEVGLIGFALFRQTLVGLFRPEASSLFFQA